MIYRERCDVCGKGGKLVSDGNYLLCEECAKSYLSLKGTDDIEIVPHGLPFDSSDLVLNHALVGASTSTGKDTYLIY